MNGANSSKNCSLYPLFWLAVCFSLGICAGKYFDLNWKAALAASLLCAG
jgi:hypothetical protein